MRLAAARAVCVLLPIAGQAGAQVAGKPPANVTVYRCTDASGRVSIGDAPCRKGQAQQMREMQRPQEAPAKPVSPALPMRQAASVPAPVVQAPVYLAPPRPMYECTTPDGAHYTSDDGNGNPRWVPLWTLGYPVVRPKSSLGSNIGQPNQQMHPRHRDVNWPVATGGGTWISDSCAMLPPEETCARLRDRRDAIRTRFFNAQEKERDRLRLEERGINARLENDCNGR